MHTAIYKIRVTSIGYCVESQLDGQQLDGNKRARTWHNIHR